jgi:excisionase family DNA binding protein
MDCRESRYLGRKEGSAYLGVSMRLYDSWVAAERIPVIRAGRRVLADRADLDAFYRSLKGPAQAQPA